MTETDGAETPEETQVRALPDDPVLRALFDGFENAEWVVSSGQDTAVLSSEDLRSFAQAAKDAGFEVCPDVTAVDYHRIRRIRFEVVVTLLSLQHNRRLRLRVPLAADSLTIPSLVPVYPGTNFFEREVYDMFGIVFEDHPDLTRILMPDDWVGHPLRKDFATGTVPVQFKDAHKVS